MVYRNARYFPRTYSLRRRTRGRSAYRRPIRRRRGVRSRVTRNSRTINRVARIQRSHMITTDWVMTDSIPMTYRQWNCVPLIDPAGWTNIMRTSIEVGRENSIFIKRGVLNLYTALTGGQASVTWNIFLVRLRKNFANMDLQSIVNTPIPTPTPPIPYWTNQGTYYRGNAYGKVTLNQGLLRVLKHWYFTLTDDRIAGQTVEQAGTPSSTYRRMQINLPINQKINGQMLLNWKIMNADNIPFYNQTYLLCVPDCADQTAINTVQYEFLTTAVSTD